eukprot:TRINITY_DN76525_c0_g1_i1.p1 TRINITY_DN76525_c0_g1~~TRINITY_DN76525_c0_g1_i1.p1  ORF type:complete len:207 (+),score=41.15 TRINITY_DN76525_c0_g1_i1:128-748(+)
MLPPQPPLPFASSGGMQTFPSPVVVRPIMSASSLPLIEPAQDQSGDGGDSFDASLWAPVINEAASRNEAEKIALLSKMTSLRRNPGQAISANIWKQSLLKWITVTAKKSRFVPLQDSLADRLLDIILVILPKAAPEYSPLLVSLDSDSWNNVRFRTELRRRLIEKVFPQVNALQQSGTSEDSVVFAVLAAAVIESNLFGKSSPQDG